MRRRASAAAVLVLSFCVGLVLVSGGELLAAPQRVLFDAYARLLPRERSGAPVVIVAIDDASLRELGQWPWPRQRLAELVGRILADRPVALGIDMIWPEPDRLSPQRWIREQDDLPPDLEGELLALSDHDALLGAALADAPVAIGVAGLRDGSTEAGGPLAPVRVIGGEAGAAALAELPGFDALLRSVPVLDRSARGHGLLTVDRDPDGVIRRMPLLATTADRLVPSFALEILRIASGVPWLELHLRRGLPAGVAAGPIGVATGADAGVWPWLSARDSRRFVAAADVLAGRTPEGFFEQRIVLLGVTGLGLVDLPITPLGPMPGSEIHAQLLENLLARELLVRPAWAERAEAALLALVGGLLILTLPRLQLRWWFPAILVASGALLTLGLAAFHHERWLLDVASPVAGSSFVFVALLGGTLAEADTQRRRLRRQLEAERLAAAKVEGELAAAARIQEGMLPRPDDLAPDPRFELDASLVPARHVGGDLYDFFALDEDRLFLVLGDVSGKGVPASLFMALGKTLCKSCALQGEKDVGTIVRRVDRELSRENPEMMFVTLFAGILDLATGELCFCNAGHEPAFLVRPGTEPRRLQSEGGPPLCTIDAFPYATETYAMHPGEILCLVTDGVTEATDPAGELMGAERVEAALGALGPGAGGREAQACIRDAVRGFVSEAEPFDDLAVLALRWSGTATTS